MSGAAEALLLVACFAASCISAGVAQVFNTDSGGGISCYVCSSINGSNPACHDTFDSSLVGLTTPCNQGRSKQTGVFPARFCYKLKGTRQSDGLPIIIRRCSVDPLVNNVMKSHCGYFKIQTDGVQQQFTGCVSNCRFDGCNSATTIKAAPGGLALPLLPLLLLLRP